MVFSPKGGFGVLSLYAKAPLSKATGGVLGRVAKRYKRERVAIEKISGSGSVLDGFYAKFGVGGWS